MGEQWVAAAPKKKAASSYAVWLEESRAAIIKEIGSSSVIAVSAAAFEKWKAVPEQEKAVFEKRAQELRDKAAAEASKEAAALETPKPAAESTPVASADAAGVPDAALVHRDPPAAGFIPCKLTERPVTKRIGGVVCDACGKLMTKGTRRKECSCCRKGYCPTCARASPTCRGVAAAVQEASGSACPPSTTDDQAPKPAAESTPAASADAAGAAGAAAATGGPQSEEDDAPLAAASRKGRPHGSDDDDAPLATPQAAAAKAAAKADQAKKGSWSGKSGRSGPSGQSGKSSKSGQEKSAKDKPEKKKTPPAEGGDGLPPEKKSRPKKEATHEKLTVEFRAKCQKAVEKYINANATSWTFSMMVEEVSEAEGWENDPQLKMAVKMAITALGFTGLSAAVPSKVAAWY